MSSRWVSKFFVAFFRVLFIIAVFAVVFVGSAGFGMFMGIMEAAPEVSVESIVPMGYASNVYDSKGNLTDTLVMAGSNRAEVSYEELPQDLIDAFVAIEDARFWQHKGVDLRAILRAAKGVLTDDFSGGASTITQQLIKNNVFNGGRETSFGAKMERKIQEQYLATQLEKTMDKKLILTNYLNTINLGNNTLGVKMAAKRYFDKNVSDLTLSECAVIAGITQNPTKLNPLTGKEKNAEKRKVILKYMYDQNYITKEEWDEALADDVYSRIQNVALIARDSANTYSYFTDELINQVTETLVDELDYTTTQAHNLLYSGGLSIYTTQDPDIQAIVDEECNDPENYVTTKYSMEYRLSVEGTNGETTHYSEKSVAKWHKENGDSYNGLYSTEEDAKNDAEAYKEMILKDGGKVIGETFTTTLQPQTSFVLIEQSTGHVKAVSGGRGVKAGSLTLNRSTDTLRQPGSTFKVLGAFGPAIDACGATLGSVYYDDVYTQGSKTFRNWYSAGHIGWSNIRDGIIYSMNIIAVRCLIETVSAQVAISYLENFGITSLTDSDYNAATALGGITYGVSNLELTGAYAAIADGGYYKKPLFFTKIYDHKGKLLYDAADRPVEENERRVLKESSAFLLTDAMRESMMPNHIYAHGGVNISSTSTRARLDNMSCAGKSGTTTNNHDIWFVGFTPYYTAGIWAGYDENQATLSGETSFHKDIWKKIMDRVHEGLSDPGFSKPANIMSAQICRKSGKLAVTGLCDCDPRGSAVYTEYFEEGTAPTAKCDHHVQGEVCAITHLLPTETCTEHVTGVYMVVPDGSGSTDDSIIAYPKESCSTHFEEFGVPLIEPGEYVGPGYVPIETDAGTDNTGTGPTDSSDVSNRSPGGVVIVDKPPI